jgi:hypothetical protein
VEIVVALSANFTFFNGLLLFAQFQGNYFFPTRQFAARRKIVRDAKHVKSEQCEDGTKKYSRSHDVPSKNSAMRNELVPLWRPLEAHFNDLVRIGDVIPTAVRLPAFGYDLNESTTEWGFRDVGDAFAVGFDI